MSAASEALADVRGWLCDNLSAGDAGRVCGMLSVVSRHIVVLEEENAKLQKERDYLLHNESPTACEVRRVRSAMKYINDENAKLREFATLAWQVLTRNEPLYVWQGMVDDARELGLEEMTDGRADD